MDVYAKKECADCHAIFPANEMVPIRNRTLVGESSRPVRHRNDGGYWVNATETTQHFSYESKWLCQECDARRTREMIVAAILALVVLTVAIAAIYLWFQLNRPSAASGDLLAVDNHVDFSTSPPDNSLMPDNGQIGSGSSTEEAAPQGAPLPDAAATRAASSYPSSAAGIGVDQASDDTAELSTAILAATQKALEKGKTEQWKAGGKSGYALVSDAQNYGDRICRNVSATLIEGQSQTQSGTHEWCKPSKGGDWSPASGSPTGEF